MKHYIGMAGLHGCLPDVCEVYANYNDAVDSLCQTHDLGPYSRFRRELKRYGYVELSLQTHGNDYASVTSCDCEEPWVHSENVDITFMNKTYVTKEHHDRGLFTNEEYRARLETLAQEFLND